MKVAKRCAVQKTLVMGVLNVSPDSFYNPSTVVTPEDAVARARQAVSDGADIVDIGGESSRPGAEAVSPEQELARIMPILEALRPLELRISVDTYHAETARQALALGTEMINDITALRGDKDMAAVIADADSECVLMHMQGEPRSMQENPVYDDVVDDICAFFDERIEFATRQGIREDKIWLDPGFGFGKTVDHNLTILRRLDEFARFNLPVMIGTSNKSTIGAVLDAPIDERAEGTAATVAIAICNGADCVRVHDVKSMARVAHMCDTTLGKVSLG